MKAIAWSNRMQLPTDDSRLKTVTLCLPTFQKWKVEARTEVGVVKFCRSNGFDGYGTFTVSLVVLGLGVIYEERWNV
jgi:hypothetical protein